MVDILTGRYDLWNLPDSSPVELDLGCGKGGFLIALASRYPDRTVVGVDVMLGRLRKVDRKVERQALTNVRLLRANAWEFIGHALPDQTIDRIHILNPDPWPKARHRSKRLLSSEFLGRLAAKLVPRGVLHISTDDCQYMAFIKEAISPLHEYIPAEDALRDIVDLKTDFELKFETAGTPVEHIAYKVSR